MFQEHGLAHDVMMIIIVSGVGITKNEEFIVENWFLMTFGFYADVGCSTNISQWNYVFEAHNWNTG